MIKNTNFLTRVRLRLQRRSKYLCLCWLNVCGLQILVTILLIQLNITCYRNEINQQDKKVNIIKLKCLSRKRELSLTNRLNISVVDQ